MRNQIIFVDYRVTNYQSLLDSLAEPAEVFVLNSESDGLMQMVNWLNSQTGIDAIHVISHGRQGTLYLGSTVLDSGNLSEYRAQLDSIGSTLAATGDLLLYGCNVAQGDGGLQFLTALALATGTDVAASDDATGASIFEGDSVLEQTMGLIETTVLSVDTFNGLLAANTAPTFGVNAGKLTTDFGSEDYGTSVRLQTDGKIVVAGYTGDPNVNFALARYNVNGSLDTSFDGDGKVTTDFGSADYGSSVTLQTDGKIVVAGYTTGSHSNFALARYNVNGSLDTSFDGDGKLTTDFGSDDFGRSVTIQTDGKIVVAGFIASGIRNAAFALARYNANGSVDTSFSGDGKVTTEFSFELNFGPEATGGYSVTLQADGKILVAGSTYNGADNATDFALTRYNTDGSLDTSFDSDGKVTTDFFGGWDYGYSVTVQADGKILLAGTARNRGDNSEDFALVRYNTNGSLDTSFDGDGKLTTSFDSQTSIHGSQDYGYSVTLQADGKILLAGEAEGYFALARYNANGSLDTSFDGDGKQITPFGTAKSVTVQTDGKILLAGDNLINSGGVHENFSLLRYNANGSLDASFGDVVGRLNGNPTYTGSRPVALDTDVQIYDTELFAINNYSGATLTLARHAGADSSDVFSLSTGYEIPSGTYILVDGVQIALVVGNSNGTLQLGFTSSATQASVNTVLQNIAYANTANVPPSQAKIDWEFSDGNTGAQGSGGSLRATGSTLVTITARNVAPVLAHPLSDFLTPPGQFFTHVLPITAFTDANSDTVLTYKIAMNDGSVLPTWLRFDPATRTLSGTPGTFGPYDMSEFDIKVTAVDPAGASASDVFRLRVVSDTKAPTVITFSPTDQATNVAITGNIAMTFDEPIILGTGSIVLKTAAGVVVAVYDVATSSNLSISDNTLVINPTANFNYSTEYRVELAHGNIKDLIGNSYTGTTSYNFSTEARPINTAPTFGVINGVVTTDNGEGFDIVLQADGKILVGGTSNFYYAMVRYHADGSLDTSFDTDGLVTYEYAPRKVGYGIALQTDGKILLVGEEIGGSDINRSWLGLTRFNANGSEDISFGDSGSTWTSFGQYSSGHSVILQSDGKILVAGTSDGNFAVARYTNNGYLDISFNADGMVTTDFGGDDDGRSIIMQADGKILVAGESNSNFALVRFKANGSLDDSFGTNGKVTTGFRIYDGSHGIALQADGKILVVGYSDGDFALARYDTDGSLDNSFDTDGKVLTDFGSSDSGYDTTLQVDGKILVAGYSDDNFALARYNVNGSLDVSFGLNGKVITEFGKYEQGYSITLQADGKILVAGSSSDGFIVVRFNIDGSIDSNFGLANKLGKQVVNDNSPVVLANDSIRVYDKELSTVGSYNGAMLTLERHGGANANDVFTNYGGGNFQSGDYFSIEGVIVGQVFENTNGKLTLGFGQNATQALVDDTLRQMAYANKSTMPEDAVVYIDWKFSDGNTGAQGVGGALSAIGSSQVTIVKNNVPPTVAHALPDVKVLSNGTFSYTLPTNTFGDVNAGDPLPINVSLIYGYSLPNWLSFNAATRTLIGSPGIDAIAREFNIVVTATDVAGASVSDVFLLMVETGDNLAGTPDENVLLGASGNNKIYGLAGNDSLGGGTGNDTIDGGAGIDTTIYSGNLSNYTITKSGNTYTVYAKTGTDGIDTLTNIESLKFVDLSVNLQVQSIAAAALPADVARISELYVAFFNRTPDADGLAYWISQHAAGQSISQISESFYSIGASPTFGSLTGFTTSMTNKDFINVFYKNVLGRPEGADAGGLEYWNGKLSTGESTRSSLANDILGSAHTFKGNTTWGWVADLLDNKIAVANKIAVEWGLTYNTDAYSHGVSIAQAITPTDINAALALVGIADADLSLG